MGEFKAMSCAGWPEALRNEVLAGISSSNDLPFSDSKKTLQPYYAPSPRPTGPSTPPRILRSDSDETAGILQIMVQAYKGWGQDTCVLEGYSFTQYTSTSTDKRNNVIITTSVLAVTQLSPASPMPVDLDTLLSLSAGAFPPFRLQSPTPFSDRPLRIPTPVPNLEEVGIKRRRNSQSVAAQVLQKVKTSRPDLIDQFLRKLPKCDLHNHLTPDPDDNLHYAKTKGLYFDRAAKKFTHEPGHGRIAAAHLALDEYADDLRKYYNSVKMPNKPWTTKQTTKFFKAFATILSTKIPLEMQLSAEVKKSMQNNIHYLELMIDFKHHADPDLTDFSMQNLQGYLAKLMPWCEAYSDYWIEELDRIGNSVRQKLGWEQPFFSADNPVYVAFLAEVMRTPSIDSGDTSMTLARFFADAAAGMLLAKKAPNKVVGINVAGPEHNPIARELFNEQMDILDFLYTAFGEPNIALHAGELTREISSTSDMQNRIRISIDKGHAKRIGHGTCISQADDPLNVIETMKGNKVPVEICFASSKQIHGVEVSVHPFKLYFNKKVPIILGSDDPNILNTDLTQEFITAFMNVDCTYFDLKDWVRNSLEFSFLPGESIFLGNSKRYTYRPEFSPLEYDGPLSQAALAIMESSPKAKMQIKLEKDLNKFESNVLKLWNDWTLVDPKESETSLLTEPHILAIQQINRERSPSVHL